MSCVDGSHIARVDLMDWLGSGAVLCPACFCGAYDRCGLTAFCTRGTETTASPLSHLDGTMAAQKFAVLAVGIHVSRTGTTFDQHRVSALGRKRTFAIREHYRYGRLQPDTSSAASCRTPWDFLRPGTVPPARNGTPLHLESVGFVHMSIGSAGCVKVATIFHRPPRSSDLRPGPVQCVPSRRNATADIGR